ncbi:MAG: GGDEF domain-containing protein [Metallibacterium sp.]
MFILMPHSNSSWIFLGVLMALGLLCALAPPARATQVILRGAWMMAPAQQKNSAQPPDAATARTLQTFDTRGLVHLPRGSRGTWVRLLPAAGAWPTGEWMLVIDQPGLGVVDLHAAGQAPQRQALEDLDQGALHTPGQLAFRLENLRGDAPLWLFFQPNPWLGSSMHFALRTPQSWAQQASGWLAFVSSALTVLVVMSLMGLWFGMLLRDRAYLLYAVYVLAYALLSAVSMGYAFHPLQLGWVARDPAMVARVAGGIAGAASILFAARFADLYHHLPWSRRLVQVLAGLFIAIALLSLAPWAAPRALGGWLQNPVVVLAGPSVLILLILAWSRGSRYAGFFLLGWSPLVVLTVCDSLQSFDLLQSWMWLQRASLAAAAFEALVLIAGLADRTLAARRDHRQALHRAEVDALTGTLNRGALLTRLQEMLELGSGPLSVLFIDLDHFKRLNDHAGHQAGDQALVALVRTMRMELREDDLLGRYGGEEFMVLLPGQSLSQALGVAERLLQAVRLRRLAISTDLPGLTVSIGAAEAQLGESLPQLLGRADQAMYAAKRNGRDQVQANPLPQRQPLQG